MGDYTNKSSARDGQKIVSQTGRDDSSHNVAGSTKTPMKGSSENLNHSIKGGSAVQEA